MSTMQRFARMVGGRIAAEEQSIIGSVGQLSMYCCLNCCYDSLSIDDPDWIVSMSWFFPKCVDGCTTFVGSRCAPFMRTLTLVDVSGGASFKFSAMDFSYVEGSVALLSILVALMVSQLFHPTHKRFSLSDDRQQIPRTILGIAISVSVVMFAITHPSAPVKRVASGS